MGGRTRRGLEREKERERLVCETDTNVPLGVRLQVRMGVLGSIYGVFDGHGGALAAEYAGKHLPKNVRS